MLRLPAVRANAARSGPIVLGFLFFVGLAFGCSPAVQKNSVPRDFVYPEAQGIVEIEQIQTTLCLCGVVQDVQVEIFVYSLEQNGASIGAAVRLIKGNGNRPVKMCSEKYRLCGRLSHRKASFGVCNLIGVK
jgi:hypothetical protein